MPCAPAATSFANRQAPKGGARNMQGSSPESAAVIVSQRPPRQATRRVLFEQATFSCQLCGRVSHAQQQYMATRQHRPSSDLSRRVPDPIPLPIRIRTPSGLVARRRATALAVLTLTMTPLLTSTITTTMLIKPLRTTRMAAPFGLSLSLQDLVEDDDVDDEDLGTTAAMMFSSVDEDFRDTGAARTVKRLAVCLLESEPVVMRYNFQARVPTHNGSRSLATPTPTSISPRVLLLLLVRLTNMVPRCRSVRSSWHSCALPR
ncbi:hypothetical protein K523DRAFT_159704 [Schizophyllum commune Tattone D]|nr:hypothetical protein K523DRAFT_159704 [Schizophyllum commune Tattone D]